MWNIRKIIKSDARYIKYEYILTHEYYIKYIRNIILIYDVSRIIHSENVSVGSMALEISSVIKEITGHYPTRSGTRASTKEKSSLTLNFSSVLKYLRILFFVGPQTVDVD